jgi:proteasome inhibitor subunit 1 (PI31)
VSNVSFDIAEIVKSQKGALTTLIPSIGDVLERIRKELIEPVFNGNKKDTQTQTAEATRQPTVDPLRYEPR